MFLAPAKFDVAIAAVNARFGGAVLPPEADEPMLSPESAPLDVGHIVSLSWQRRYDPTVSRETPLACETWLLALLAAIEGAPDLLAVWRRMPNMARDAATNAWCGTFRLEVYQLTEDRP